MGHPRDFVALLGLSALALATLVPLLVSQATAFVSSLPDLARQTNGALRGLIETLAERGLLGGSAEDFLASLQDDLLTRARDLAEAVLGGLLGFVSGALGLALGVFGMLFVAAYLLSDVRRIKAAYLRAVPRRYRRDAEELWGAFVLSLSRYLSGLALVAFAQGALAGLAVWSLGVPYPLPLGA